MTLMETVWVLYFSSLLSIAMHSLHLPWVLVDNSQWSFLWRVASGQMPQRIALLSPQCLQNSAYSCLQESNTKGQAFSLKTNTMEKTNTHRHTHTHRNTDTFLEVIDMFSSLVVVVMYSKLLAFQTFTCILWSHISSILMLLTDETKIVSYNKIRDNQCTFY